MPINQKMFEALQPGVNQLTSEHAALNRQALQGEQEQTLAKLKAYLQAQTSGASRGATQAELQKLLAQNPGLVKNATGVSLDANGNLQLNDNSYMRQMFQGQKEDASARAKAMQVYTQGVAKLEPQLSAVSEGLSATNDPKSSMTRGAALGLITKAMGLSRFPTTEEQVALLPPSSQGFVSSVMNWAGSPHANLQPGDISSLNSFFKQQGLGLYNEHDALKQNAMKTYATSNFASPEGLQALSGLGAPIDAQFEHLKQTYANTPQTRDAGLQPQGQPANIQTQPTGIAGFFSRLMTGGGGQQSAPQPQAAQAQQQPVGALDPGAIAAELQKRSAQSAPSNTGL